MSLSPRWEKMLVEAVRTNSLVQFKLTSDFKLQLIPLHGCIIKYIWSTCRLSIRYLVKHCSKQELRKREVARICRIRLMYNPLPSGLQEDSLWILVNPVKELSGDLVWKRQAGPCRYQLSYRQRQSVWLAWCVNTGMAVRMIFSWKQGGWWAVYSAVVPHSGQQWEGTGSKIYFLDSVAGMGVMKQMMALQLKFA